MCAWGLITGGANRCGGWGVSAKGGACFLWMLMVMGAKACDSSMHQNRDHQREWTIRDSSAGKPGCMHMPEGRGCQCHGL